MTRLDGALSLVPHVDRLAVHWSRRAPLALVQ